MKIRKLTVASLIFCAISMVCYYGYDYMSRQMTDQTYPVIEMEEEELVISIEDGAEALLEGVTAYDEKDGDVTDSLIVESVSRFVNGKRTVTYVAFDRDNHVSKATRDISYSDYESPKFVSKEGYRFAVGTKSVLDNMMATDCIDGDITDAVKVTPGFYVDTYSPGTYAFQYQVANSAGDVEYLPITVEIYDPSDSKVLDILLTEYVVYTTKGNRIEPRDYLQEGFYGVSIDESKVDYNTPGTYEITYSMKVGDSRGTNRLAVVVR